MSTLRIPVTARDHALGPADAPVTLVEYADYQCPYCGEAYGVVKQLKERFGDDLRLVFRNFPLPDLHPEALSAAITAEFAATAGHFWPVHDALFENQDELGEGLYSSLLQQVGLDPSGPDASMRTPLEQRIQDDEDGGLRSGVNGTPAFFVNGSLDNLQGGFDDLARPIEELLRGSGR